MYTQVKLKNNSYQMSSFISFFNFKKINCNFNIAYTIFPGICGTC